MLYLLRTPLSLVQQSRCSLPVCVLVFASSVESSACPGGTLNGTKHLSKGDASSQLKEPLMTSVHLHLAGMPAFHKAF